MNSVTSILSSALIVGAASLLLFAIGPAQRTSWHEVERRLPTVLALSDLRVVAEQTEDGDMVPLSWLQSFREVLRPRPVAHAETGFPDSVMHHSMAGPQDQTLLHCLVRYASGDLACIVLRFPPSLRQEAVVLREALQREFPRDDITMNETTGH